MSNDDNFNDYVILVNHLGPNGPGPEVEIAIPALIVALRHEDQSVRWGAVEALKKIGRGAVPALIAALRDEHSHYCWVAAWALKEIGPAAKDAVPTLIAALRDEITGGVRFSALEALAEIGHATKDAVPDLIDVLGEGDEDVPFEAIRVLENIGRDAVPALIVALRDNVAPRDNNIRLTYRVAQVLRKIGPAAKDAVPDLINMLRHDYMAYRRWAARALGGIGPAAKDAVPDLIDLLQDGYCRTHAAQALSEIGLVAVPELIDALRDENVNICEGAAEVFRQIGHDAIQELIRALRHKDRNVRCRAAEILGVIGHEAKHAVPELIVALQDEDDHVRLASENALKAIDNDVATTVLEMLRKEADAAESAIKEHARTTKWDVEAKALMDQLKVFYLVRRLYAEGAKSRYRASEILGQRSKKGYPVEGLATSPAEMTRLFNKELPRLFKKIFNVTVFKFFEKDKNDDRRLRFSADGEKAWAWTDDFLRRTLPPDWFGFSHRLTPDVD